MSSKLVHDLFNEPKTGFVGEGKLFHRARVDDPTNASEEVKQYLKQMEVHLLFQKPQELHETHKSMAKSDTMKQIQPF